MAPRAGWNVAGLKPTLDLVKRCSRNGNGNGLKDFFQRHKVDILWLRALRDAMCRERRKGRAVLLAGDLNLKHRIWDSHWSCLSLECQDLLPSLESQDGTGPETLQLLRLVAFHWPDLLEAFRNKEVTPMETRTADEMLMMKWAVWAKPFRAPSPPQSSAAVRIGPPMEDEGMAKFSFQVDGVGVDEDGSPGPQGLLEKVKVKSLRVNPPGKTRRSVFIRMLNHAHGRREWCVCINIESTVNDTHKHLPLKHLESG
eukprot:Skav211492  [mRNA]  locus=scaffold2188:537468:543243:+ [translate_table: standard]